MATENGHGNGNGNGETAKVRREIFAGLPERNPTKTAITAVRSAAKVLQAMIISLLITPLCCYY
jgi:hypothetical protein